MFVKMLTHIHMVVYTWWCWHIYKGEDVRFETDQLGEETEVKIGHWRRPDAGLGRTYASDLHA